MAKKKVEAAEDTGTWMNTYSDLVTLLLTFFVLLYSMSSIEAEKWERFASAFSRPGNDTNQVVLGEDSGDALAPPDTFEDSEVTENELMTLDDLFLYLQKYVEENNMQSAVELQKVDDTVFIRFNNNIFFYPDLPDLRPESMPMLEFLGGGLKVVEDQILLININGHTASVEYDSYHISAWTLSGERATNIAIFFEDRMGLDPKKLRPIGYANNYPVAPNSTPEGRSQNRRVDIIIVGNKGDMEGLDYGEFAELFDPSAFPKSGSAQELLTPEP